MRARSSARGSESTSETRDTLSSSKGSLLPSTSSSWESEASSLLGQPQHLPAGLPHNQVTFLPLGRTLLTLLNPLSMSHPRPRKKPVASKSLESPHRAQGARLPHLSSRGDLPIAPLYSSLSPADANTLTTGLELLTCAPWTISGRGQGIKRIRDEKKARPSTVVAARRSNTLILLLALRIDSGLIKAIWPLSKFCCGHTRPG